MRTAENVQPIARTSISAIAMGRSHSKTARALHVEPPDVREYARTAHWIYVKGIAAGTARAEIVAQYPSNAAVVSSREPTSLPLTPIAANGVVLRFQPGRRGGLRSA